MANEAQQKEPTMEEILASIRKIISDDEPAAAPPPRTELHRRPGPLAAAVPPVPVNDLEDLSFEMHDDDADLGMFEADDPLTEVAMAPPPEPVRPAPLRSQTPNRAAPSPRPASPPVQTFPDAETNMPASPRYNQTVLTDEQTAETAAGALGKLISRMDLGGDNTIEGLVREMLRPMIKEWLDANLARIVEEKVEAEVQRIARMAR